MGKLEALSPLSVLSRGYAMVKSNGCVLTDVTGVTVGDMLDIRLSSGEITAKVEELK